MSFDLPPSNDSTAPDEPESDEPPELKASAAGETKTARDRPSGDEDAVANAASSLPLALPEGTVLRDEYRVEEVLGIGGFGITYRARDTRLDTEVAIKEYYPAFL